MWPLWLSNERTTCNCWRQELGPCPAVVREAKAVVSEGASILDMKFMVRRISAAASMGIPKHLEISTGHTGTDSSRAEASVCTLTAL
jgi:hypothetical protein